MFILNFDIIKSKYHMASKKARTITKGLLMLDIVALQAFLGGRI